MSDAPPDSRPIQWYRCRLDRDTLRSLTARSDWRGFRQIGLQLLITAGAGVGTYWLLVNGPWLLAVPALLVYGTIYSFLGLSGAGHELCHGTVFRTRFWNELFLRLVAFLSWTNFVHFRASHAGHHQWTVHRGRDLEVVLPQSLRRRDWVFLAVDVRGLWQKLATTVRHARGRLEGEWEHRIFLESNVRGRRALARWARVLLGGQLALAVVFVATGQWPLLLLVTFAPFYAGWLNFLCAFPQHAGLSHSVPDFRLCCQTMTLNPVVRFLYWQMNYHVEHHMYAAVPFHRLADLRRTIEPDLPPACRGLRGAWRELLSALARQRTDPEYAYVPPLPHPAGRATVQ